MTIETAEKPAEKKVPPKKKTLAKKKHPVLELLENPPQRSTTLEDFVERFEPKDDAILVRQMAKDEVTLGGIALPENVNLSATPMLVLKVGPGQLTTNGTRVKPDFKMGDIAYLRALHKSVLEEAEAWDWGGVGRFICVREFMLCGSE